MAKLKLILACSELDRTRPLIAGSIEAEGIELSCVCLPPREIFARMLRSQEFDVSELGLAYYILVKARGECPFVAIPVMLSRFFRHSCIFVNVDAGIEKPEDLAGKRVGVPDYAQTAGVFIRGMLHHDYGVRAEDVLWYWRPPKGAPQGTLVSLSVSKRIRLEPLPPDKNLDDMLEAGELDAIATPYLPDPFLRGSPKVRRLFPNFKEVEKEYYLRTRIFPIMHLVVVRRDIYEQHPWVARSLYDAFTKAKERALSILYEADTLKVSLPWLIDHIEESRAIFGPDLWPYGLESNRPTLEAAAQYVVEQGLTDRKVVVDELFAPETL